MLIIRKERAGYLTFLPLLLFRFAFKFSRTEAFSFPAFWPESAMAPAIFHFLNTNLGDFMSESRRSFFRNATVLGAGLMGWAESLRAQKPPSHAMGMNQSHSKIAHKKS